MSAEERIVLSDDEYLRYTQQKRKELVEDICAGGKPPTDPKDRAVLLMALDGMDRQSLTKKRIAGDAANNEAASLAAQTLGKLFDKLGNRSPYERPVEGERVIDVPAEFVPDLKTVPGEMDIGIAQLDYETFQRQASQ